MSSHVSRPTRRFAMIAAAVVAAAVAAGCSSGEAVRDLPTTLPGRTAPSMGASGTAPGGTTALMPTVPDCGAGAYEPATLLISCGSPGIEATGVKWTSWNQYSASGTGVVHVTVGGKAASGPASLNLTGVTNGPRGPQFAMLNVKWTGTSPDGHAFDSYALTPES